MSYFKFIKKFLSNQLLKVSPKIYWKRKVNYFKNNFSEVEMNLLPFLCNNQKISLDIGAAIGVYTVNMSTYSKSVIAFEPIPKNIETIQRMISATKVNASIESLALSNKSGFSTMKMIDGDSGLSTIEGANNFSTSPIKENQSLNVVTKKLDDFNYSNIGFIKLDVEGHEISVIEGAIKTLKNNHPNLLIEIEERHKKNAINEMYLLLNSIGYDCFFILNKKIKSFSTFDISQYQNIDNIGSSADNYLRKGVYINNFIFIHSNSTIKNIHELEKLL